MSSPFPAVYPSTAEEDVPCPLCGTSGNRLVVAERGIEHRFNMPVLPVSDYFQANCQSCGLLYINAPVKQDYLNGLYQNETVDWADELLGDPAKRMNDDERRRFSDVVDLVARFKNIHGTQWLDFGCQTGELGLDAISRHGVAMSGVEISPDYAERAARLWQRGPHAVRPSLEDFQRRQFDVISSLETLEHMAEPWKMVASLRKHLRPGGVLTVSVPSSHYFRLKYHVFRLVRLLVDRQAIRERPQSMRPSLYGLCHTHLYNFTPKSLSLLLEQQGLKVQYIGGIGWLSRYRILEKIASAIEMLTRRRVAIYPSVIAVAYNPPD